MSNRYSNLSRLSNGELQELVLDITKALGADPKRAYALAKDPDKLKSFITAMDDKEIDTLIKKAGAEKSKEIYKALERQRRNG